MPLAALANEPHDLGAMSINMEPTIIESCLEVLENGDIEIVNGDCTNE
jgi:hypothetical protein